MKENKNNAPQHGIKNIGLTGIKESLVLSTNFILGRQNSVPKALHFLCKPLPASVKKPTRPPTDYQNLADNFAVIRHKPT
jgi:hypothetical protein